MESVVQDSANIPITQKDQKVVSGDIESAVQVFLEWSSVEPQISHVTPMNVLETGEDSSADVELRSQGAIHSMVQWNPLTCVHCGKCFGTKRNCKRHEKTHLTGQSFRCEICQKMFAQKAYLKQHLETHGERTHTCDICNRAFVYRHQLKRHEMLHVGEKKYTCDVCHKAFARNRTLRMHQLVHSVSRPFLCPKCSKGFVTLLNLNRHLSVVHSDSKPFVCPSCLKSFPMKYYLDRHLKAHPECSVACEKNTKIIVNSEQERMLQEDTNPTFYLGKQEEVEEEGAIFQSSKDFLCPDCGKAFGSDKNLKRHVKVHRVTESKFSCDVCSKSFRFAEYLKQHLESHGERRHKCEDCGRAFVQRHQLQRHLMIHTGERPYVCNICRAAFARKSAVLLHLRTHTKDKPHSCDQCSVAFSDRQHLKRHLLTHTGEKAFPCEKCSKAFATCLALKEHTKIHTGNRKFVCRVCNKAFTRNSVFRNHLRRHGKLEDGEPPGKVLNEQKPHGDKKCRDIKKCQMEDPESHGQCRETTDQYQNKTLVGNENQNLILEDTHEVEVQTAGNNDDTAIQEICIEIKL